MTDSVARLLEAVRADERDVLLETEGLDLFETLGLGTPVRRVVGGPEDVDEGTLAAIPGTRIVIKVISPEILHKSDVGGVRIVAKQAATVGSAIADMEKRVAGSDVRGWLLAEFVEYDRSLGGELLFGMRHTEDFGPVVTVALGGTHPEFLARHFRPGREVSVFSPAVAGPAAIRATLERQAIVPLIAGGLRGEAARLPLDDLVTLVDRLLAFASEHIPRDFLELEINPLVLADRGPVAVDALARLAPRTEAAPVAAPVAPARPLEKLERLLKPETVAVMGVSDRTNPGRIIVENLLREGFPKDRLHVVKPDRAELLGCPCSPDVSSLPEPVDLLVLSIAAPQVPAVIEETIAGRKAETLIVIPGGLGETEGSGALVTRMEESIAASRRTEWGGPLINGGNSLGIRSKPGRYDTMFIPQHKLPAPEGDVSPIALVSQSGALAVARASKLSGLNPRYVISVGNQLDLTVGDYFEWLERDAGVEVFAAYVEGFRPGDGRRWLEAARRIVTAGRDVILYRAGRTAAGRLATASHTASVAGDYTVTRELATSAGVVVADSLADFEDLLLTFSRLRGKSGGRGRVAALSNAGFEAVGFADSVGSLELPELEPATVARVEEVLDRHRLSGFVDVKNPMDVTPILADEPYEEIARALLGDPGVDAAVIGCVPLTGALDTLPAGEGHSEDLEGDGSIVNRLVRLFHASTKPWVAVVDGGPLFDPMARTLEERGVPTFRTADRAMRALQAWCRHRSLPD